MKIIQLEFQGRFGNQLFQYAFARALAELHHAELQTEHWIGPSIFQGVKANPIRGYADALVSEFRTKMDPIPDVETIRLRGFFQGTMFTRNYLRSWVREWFRFRPWCSVDDCAPACVAHIRRGDLAPEKECIVSKASYDRAYSTFGYADYDHVVVDVQEENSHRRPYLPHDWMFLADFQILMKARVLFRANSTFSWWAGCLGYGRVFSPRVTGLVGHHDVEFEEGNHCGLRGSADSDIENPPDA